MNDDLISREELRRRMYHESFEVDNGMQRWDSGLWIRYKIFENAIEEAPAVEPERKKGMWETKPYIDPDAHSLEVRRCSVCKTKIIAHCSFHFNYCPNCGAEMEGTLWNSLQ